MFRKLFGETETIQFDYLKPRIIMAFIVVAGILIGLITHFIGLQSVAQVCVGIAELFYVILALMFDWRFLKSMFGFASLGALFSGNIVFGVVIMVVYFLLSIVLGLITLVLGIGRFIYLLVKKSNQGLED